MDNDWSLLGGNPSPGDAGLIRKLATDFIDVAKGALDVSTGLGGPKGDLASVWSGGTAVNIVDENIDAASDDLKKAFDSFSEAGTALRSHADALEALQSRALRLLEEAHAAQGQIDGAISNRASFEESFRATAAESGTSTLETAVQLRMQIGSYNDSIGVAEAGLENIRWQADQLRDEHRTLGQTTRRKIDAASEVGIQNAPAMSILGWQPFGDQVTWADVGHEFSQAMDDMKPVLIVTGIVLAGVATGGVGAAAAITATKAGLVLTTVEVADGLNKAARKQAGDERVHEEWWELGVEVGLGVVGVGASASKLQHEGILRSRIFAREAAENAVGNFSRESHRLGQLANHAPSPAMNRMALEGSERFAQHAASAGFRSEIISRSIPSAIASFEHAEHIDHVAELLNQSWDLYQVQKNPERLETRYWPGHTLPRTFVRPIPLRFVEQP